MRRLTHPLILGSLMLACDPVETEPGSSTPPPEPLQPSRPDGVALCYSELSQTHPATLGFNAALSEGRHADRAAVIAELTAAADENPNEEQFALLLGLAYLWRLAEPLPEEAGDLSVVVDAATNARAALERAYTLCPTDHRIPAWLGPILVNTGRSLGDDDLVVEGLAVLQQGIDHYPSFVLFSKLLVFADQPADSSDFQLALAAVEENAGECSSTANDPACINTPVVWHNVEGAAVFMGDVLAKAGKKDQALAAYEGAMASSDWATWDWQAELTARIDSIDQRIETFADANPDNDALSACQQLDQCSLCHRE
jgi:hypothetical protein